MPRADLLAAHALMAIAASQLALREAYHQVGGQSLNLVLLLSWWLVIMAMVALARWTRWGASEGRLGRAALLVCGAVSAYFIVGGSVLAAARGRSISAAWWLVAGLVVLLLVMGLLRLERMRWARFRTLLMVVGLLFVASQPVLTHVFAADVVWPRAPGAQDKPVGRSATLFVLFDELNASASAGLADVMRQQGLQVHEQAVRSVGAGTAQVIPAMFTGLGFTQARPCGWTTICSGNHVLDFSRVRASRDDIDVIGFYHPYCAMQGLRWCRRLNIPLSLADADRWRCALWYRTGLAPFGGPADECNAVYAKGPTELARAIVDSIWQAPVWKDGGMLFAHIPLPHPPAAGGGVTLGEDYRGNVRRAEALLRELLVRARRSGLDHLQVVVFSDHPLRQTTWCRIYAPYSRRGCVIDPALSDDRVPVIVGSTFPVVPTELRDNSEIFSLAARRPAGGP